MVVAHRTAQSAADLAALAGAGAIADGVDPCAAASGSAQANGARLDGLHRVVPRGDRRGDGARATLARTAARPDRAGPRRAPRDADERPTRGQMFWRSSSALSSRSRRRSASASSSFSVELVEPLLLPAPGQAALGAPLEDAEAPQDRRPGAHPDEEQPQRGHLDTEQLDVAADDLDGEDRRDDGQCAERDEDHSQQQHEGTVPLLSAVEQQPGGPSIANLSRAPRHRDYIRGRRRRGFPVTTPRLRNRERTWI